MIRKLFGALLICSLTLSLSQAALAKNTEDPLKTPIQITLDGQSEEISLYKMGVITSESKGFFFASLFKRQKPEFQWNESRAKNVIYQTFETQAPKNAYYRYAQGELTVEPEIEGHTFDVNELLTEITADYPKFNSYEIKANKPELIQAEQLQRHSAQVGNLLGEGLTVTVNDGKTYHFPAQVKDLKIFQVNEDIELRLDDAYINYVLTTLEQKVNREPRKLTIKSIPNPEGVSVVETEGELERGVRLNKNFTQSVIEDAIEQGLSEAIAVTETLETEIINETEIELNHFELLSTGVSNYEGSDEGRTHNVEFSMSEKYDDILIAPGAHFSFNELLGGPVTISNGWANAYIIVNGNELKKAPGGGVCQAATTMYRAALNAGVEITSRRNHSLYVGYYATQAKTDSTIFDGLDATIYPGQQDMSFTNNTGGYIFVRSLTTEDHDAIVEFYGVNDGRHVKLEGPFTRSNQTEESIEAVGDLGSTRMAWKQIIEWPNGDTEEEWILSRYRSTVQQY